MHRVLSSIGVGDIRRLPGGGTSTSVVLKVSDVKLRKARCDGAERRKLGIT